MRKHILGFTAFVLLLVGGGLWYMSRPDEARVSIEKLTGPKPEITEPREQRIPTVSIAEVDRWKAGEAPTVADGLVVGWWRDRPWYRTRIVVPASMAIAAVGLYWTVTRLGLG